MSYAPKTMPYNMYIGDAIKWYKNELYLIKQELKIENDSLLYGKLLGYKDHCMNQLEVLKKLDREGKVKKVNCLESR